MPPLKKLNKRFGMTRLTLINSAGYEKATIPLDQTLYLAANNNVGKTSLVRALQFFFIADYKKMNFDNRDTEKSRKHYFPSESSYLLCEARLKTGKVVLVAAGKGKLQSNQHFYFVYKGALKEDDYLSDGKRIPSNEILAHLQTRGYEPKKVSPNELTRMLIGGSRNKDIDIDLAIYPLIRQSDEGVFKDLFKNILDLLNLKASDIKELLLQVFRNDLKAGALNFKKIWEDAFKDVTNQEKLYYILSENREQLNKFKENFNTLQILNGELRTKEPIIQSMFNRWSGFFDKSSNEIIKRQKDFQSKIDSGKVRKKKLGEQKIELSRAQNEAAKWFEAYGKLYKEYENDTLESLQEEEQKKQGKYNDIVSQVHGVGGDGLNQVKKREKELVLKIENFERLLESDTTTLLKKTIELLPDKKIEPLTKLVNPQIWELPCNEPYVKIDEKKYKKTLEALASKISDNKSLTIDGLSIELKHVKGPEALATMSRKEIQDNLQQLSTEVKAIRNQLKLLNNRAKTEKLQTKLKDEWSHATRRIAEYKNFSQMTRQCEKMKNKKESLNEKNTKLEKEIESIDSLIDSNSENLYGIEGEKKSLKRKDDAVGELSKRFYSINRDIKDDHPFIPFILDEALDIEDADVIIEEHIEKYVEFERLLESLSNTYRFLVKSGYYRYEDLLGAAKKWAAIIARFENLHNEDKIIKENQRSAITIVGSALDSLSSDYYRLKRQIESLNRSYSKHKISDLQEFKIQISPLGDTLSCIETLVDAGRTATTGETLKLFRKEGIGDSQINKAYDYLLEVVLDQTHLKLEHLFTITFTIIEKNGVEKTIENFQDSGSNGTRATVKLLTGMQLIHHLVAKENQNLYRLPYYLDEASNLDINNQNTVIATANSFGFSSIFASVDTRPTCNTIIKVIPGKGRLFIEEQDWITLKPITDK